MSSYLRNGVLNRLRRRLRFSLGSIPLVNPIIRNDRLRELYKGFLKIKEEAEPTMLHREDFYGSGPPNTEVAPYFLELAARDRLRPLEEGRRVLSGSS